jgi:MFS family permease
MPAQVLQPLRHRAFRRVWIGESVSVVGDLSFETAFIWLILQTTGSTAALAVVMLAQAIPRGLLMLLGGAVTDRVSPRTVMLFSHLTRGVAVGLLAVLVVAGRVQFWQLLVLGVVTGVAEAFFWPASDSVLPVLLPPEELPRGNALTGFSEQVARLAGPVLGGALVASVGTSWAVALDAVSFFVAAATVFRAPGATIESASPLKAPVKQPVKEPLKEVAREIGDGLKYARDDRAVRIVLLLIAAATLTYSGLFSVGLPALAQTYSQGSVALGLLLSAWGLGQLIGTVAAAFTGLPRRLGLLMVGMACCEGTVFLLLGFLPDLWLAIPILALLGIGVAYSSDVALPTFIQTRTPAHLLGRISSVMNLPRVTLEPVSIAVLGVLAGHSLHRAFVVAALPMLAVGVRLGLDREALSLGGPGEPTEVQG